MRITLLWLTAIFSCQGQPFKKDPAPIEPRPSLSRICDVPPPAGFHRVALPQASFGHYLRDFPISTDNTIYYYHGGRKGDQDSHYAVLDLPVGDQDLMQCADAVMRLRIEYLMGRQEELLFYDNERTEYRLSPPYPDIDRYMKRVFSMCGTQSLSQQIRSKSMRELMLGDVFIKGGFPGHAEIVVDVVENERGEKRFMLAEGFMPAQSVHIVLNRKVPGSPWFDAADPEVLTSNYTFTGGQLKGW